MEMNEQKEQAVAISIIIPVYNVAEWLDQCIESVVNQTFTDFEALLIDDGSTDGSGTKCDEWAQRDQRIRVIHKENAGPSVARNCGIGESKGEYISFLDADDWLDNTFLEEMYGKAKKTGADLVECDIWRYNDNSHEKTYCPCYGSLGVDFTREEHMIYGYGAIWNLLIYREFWIRNQFRFDSCHSESTPIYATMIARANKIKNVKKALYYYRRFRNGSRTMLHKTDKETNVVGIKAFEYLIENFYRLDLKETYGACLERIIKYKMANLMSAFFYRMNAEEYHFLSKKYYDFIIQNFPKGKEIKYLTWGGYNLTRILWRAKYLHDPYGRFNFSSIISLMNPIKAPLYVSHKVKYREMMLEREIQNAFWTILSEVQPDYIIMDFIEERFDVIRYASGYLTKSDAYDEANIMTGEMQVIPRDGELCRQLWEESALTFIHRLETEYSNVQIVLVKNYLTEKVGDIHKQEYFDNIAQIRRMNEILSQYYRFFYNHCRTIKVVEPSNCEYYFTDKQYEYGAIPSHLNELANQRIAEMVERCIGI